MNAKEEPACRWIWDKHAPGGRFFVPGCWGGVMDRGECYCVRSGEAPETVEGRLDQIERRLNVICEAIEAQTAASGVQVIEGE